jgi:hypothetical protein
MTDLNLSQFLGEYEGVVLCPACRHSDMGGLTHPTRVEVDQGGDVVEVDRDGPGFLHRKPSARGAIIHLDFYCEGGHEFRVSFRFHKGSTYFWTTLGVDYPVAPDGMPLPLRELWRD